MLGNWQQDDAVRLEQLSEAIKRIYASTFSTPCEGYVRATPFRLEEEKMAVICQQVVGRCMGSGFTRISAESVRSHNFLSVPPMTFCRWNCGGWHGAGADGGGRRKGLCFVHAIRKSRAFSSVEDILANSQSEFGRWQSMAPARRSSELRKCDSGRDGRRGWHVAIRRLTYSAITMLSMTASPPGDAHCELLRPMLSRGVSAGAILELLVTYREDALGHP